MSNFSEEFEPIKSLTVEEFIKEKNVKGTLKYLENKDTGTCFYAYNNVKGETIYGPASSAGIKGTPNMCLVEDKNNPGELVWIMCNQGQVRVVAEWD